MAAFGVRTTHRAVLNFDVLKDRFERLAVVVRLAGRAPGVFEQAPDEVDVLNFRVLAANHVDQLGDRDDVLLANDQVIGAALRGRRLAFGAHLLHQVVELAEHVLADVEAAGEAGVLETGQVQVLHERAAMVRIAVIGHLDLDPHLHGVHHLRRQREHAGHDLGHFGHDAVGDAAVPVVVHFLVTLAVDGGLAEVVRLRARALGPPAIVASAVRHFGGREGGS